MQGRCGTAVVPKRDLPLVTSQMNILQQRKGAPMSGQIELVEYDEELHETDDALLFLIDGEKVWIPKLVIEAQDEETGMLEVAAWFCEKEGLV